MTKELFRIQPGDMISELRSGMTGIVGSFSSRIDPPTALLRALADSDIEDLTMVVLAVSNDMDMIGRMVERGMVRKVVTGFNNGNQSIDTRRREGKVEIEFVPYGVLVERIRLAAGGIPSFFSPVGVGTVYEEGRETREFNGQRYILEHTIRPDFALIRGWQADTRGNIRYWPSAVHLNHCSAMASATVFAEVDEVVEDMSAEDVDTSFVYLDGIFSSRSVQAQQQIKSRNLL